MMYSRGDLVVALVKQATMNGDGSPRYEIVVNCDSGDALNHLASMRDALFIDMLKAKFVERPAAKIEKVGDAH